MDNRTDKSIQKVINEEFKDTTLLAIAHRISSVVNYDKVVMMGNGKIVECDNPQTLLADSSSLFKQEYDAFMKKY